VWDLPVRIFHWSLALAFAGAYVLGESEHWRNVHVTLGYAVIGLLCFRLMWGFVGTHFARFRSFAYTPAQALGYLLALIRGRARHYTGHNPAGSWAIYGLIALGFATGLTGWLRYEDVGGEALAELHEGAANAWLALVGLHVLAVVGSSLLHRENLARAMVTGYKQGAPDEGIRSMAPVVGLALLLAIIVSVCGWLGWGSTDPGPSGQGGGEDARASGGEQDGMAGRRRIDDD
jgi:cytochrome b